ncbi:hypothetical protein [Burkholderia ambifaria]|jgi:hypothetical protein|uniref:hypothetical protein n=1 Tax=Burkholderia ambifaria TaxID=152480 RepID=UPI00158B9D3A|nr:hypothetical protein [Burkholderia ambifaria]
MGIFDEVTQRLGVSTSSATGFAIAGATRLAGTKLGRYLPTSSRGFQRGPSGIYQALNKDYAGAAVSAIGALGLDRTLSDTLSRSKISEMIRDGVPNLLLGGITASEAQRICDEVQATHYAKKNLFYIEISDFIPVAGFLGLPVDSGLFNFFATSVSVAPMIITGEGRQIGSGVMDAIHGTERLELRVTTLDDAAGSMKQWFRTRKDALARPDGTFGVPADYLLQVRLLHAAINDQVMAQFGGYEERYIVRPTTLDTELSRHEDGLQEIQMSFSQFDTFMFDQS